MTMEIGPNLQNALETIGLFIFVVGLFVVVAFAPTPKR